MSDCHKARRGSPGERLAVRVPSVLPAVAAALLAAAGSARAAPPASAPPSRWLQPAAAPPSAETGAPKSDNCLECHAQLLGRKVAHSAMTKMQCADCHKPTRRVGRCKSASASAWALSKTEGELCGSCHAPAKLGAGFQARHDTKGRCAPCHDAHGSDLPRLMRTTGRKLCLPCHDGRYAPGEVPGEARIAFDAKVVHAPAAKADCQACHQQGHGGPIPKLLKNAQPNLCYECHKRLDETRVVHTAIRQGECVECHAAHSSDVRGLLKKPREQVCLGCHDIEPLVSRPVRHAPVAEGRCLDCHGAHGGDRTAFIRGTGSGQCLSCHDAKAPATKGAPGATKRVDLSRKIVHAPLKSADCNGCHDAGHGSESPKLLKSRAVDLCYKCHQRQDGHAFRHGAVVVGDCAGCHDPHSSNQPKLVVAAPSRAVCFRCHQDDVTGRKYVHAPVASGDCTACHGAHGAKNQWLLKLGAGKQACYGCHQPVDTGAVKHAAIERYGCTGCHDPHGTGERFLLPQKVNAVCVKCHEAQSDGRHITSLGASAHPVSAPSDPRKPDRPFTCASCHNPHGSGSPKLLIRGKTPLGVCAACHGDKTGEDPTLKDIAYRSRRQPTTSGSAGGAGAGGAGAGGAGAGGAGSGGAGGGGAGGDAPGNASATPSVPGAATPPGVVRRAAGDSTPR